MNLNKIASPVIFILVNLAIILIVELAGGGLFFYETGFIHALAIIFILLTIARISSHSYTHDQFLEKFIHATLAASLIFSLSHIIEYINMHIYGLYGDVVFVNVVNFYLIGFILITLGAESFLRRVKHRSTLMLKVAWLAILILAASIVLFNFRPHLISLEMDSLTPWIYSFLSLVVGLIGILTVIRIKKTVSAANNFGNYLIASLILIIGAIFPYIFYEFIEEGFGIPLHQIISSSHFLFFAALSLLFLAFGKLSWGGIYEEARKIAKE